MNNSRSEAKKAPAGLGCSVVPESKKTLQGWWGHTERTRGSKRGFPQATFETIWISKPTMTINDCTTWMNKHLQDYTRKKNGKLRGDLTGSWGWEALTAWGHWVAFPAVKSSSRTSPKEIIPVQRLVTFTTLLSETQKPEISKYLTTVVI